jgi:hypothetical protein
MIDVAGVEAELLTSGNTITINVFDESHKPLATKGFTASALVVRGSKREIVLWLPQAKTRSRVMRKATRRGRHQDHDEDDGGEIHTPDSSRNVMVPSR